MTVQEGASACAPHPSIHREIESGRIHGQAKLVKVAIHAPFIAPE
jgi:hypothetical protein